jgi:hypothetical protein
MVRYGDRNCGRRMTGSTDDQTVPFFAI